MKRRTFVAGIFDDAGSAVDAIQELRRSGFSDDQLGFVVRYDTDEHGTNPLARRIADNLPGVKNRLFPPPSEADLALEQHETPLLLKEKFRRAQEKDPTEIIISCVIGGTLGTVAILLLPDIGPVVAGGTLAATLSVVASGGMLARLLSIGIAEHATHHYEQHFCVGNIIFTLKAAEQPQDAQDILRYHRAFSIQSH